jgi:hypothetical protein
MLKDSPDKDGFSDVQGLAGQTYLPAVRAKEPSLVLRWRSAMIALRSVGLKTCRFLHRIRSAPCRAASIGAAPPAAPRRFRCRAACGTASGSHPSAC